MKTFAEIFKFISENNISGNNGAFGNTAYINNADGTYINYANNDSRIPKILGKNKKRKKIKIFKRK